MMSVQEQAVPGTLPNEIWMRVLKSLRFNEYDLPFLWVICRQVNTAFRATAESIFQRRVLPKFMINFQLDYYQWSPDDRAQPLSCEFEFARLSEDGQTAILSIGNGFDGDVLLVVETRMQRALRDPSDIPAEDPPYMIQLRRDFTDGPLPGLSFDGEKVEVSCDWKAVFTAFYGEHFLWSDMLSKAVDSRKPWLEGMRDMFETGQMPQQDMMLKAFGSFADDDKLARKAARRARIKKQMSDKGYSYDPTGDEEAETAALKSIQVCRHYAGYQDVSDEEDEEDAKVEKRWALVDTEGDQDVETEGVNED